MKITNPAAGLFFWPHEFCRADSFRPTLTQMRAVIKKESIMSTTQPIRSKEALRAFKEYYLYQEPHFRNYALPPGNCL